MSNFVSDYDAHLASLMEGAIDLHAHGYPDVGLQWPARLQDIEVAALARDAGMRGYVLKSHLWPTADRAFHLNQRLSDEQFTVFGSLTLNPIVGGLSAMSVEAAATQGASVVFFPTWGARNDHDHGSGVVRSAAIDTLLPNFGPRLEEAAISVLDDEGRLVPAAHEVLDAIAAEGMALCTAHLSARESLVLLREAKARGIDRTVFSHPLSSSIGASREAIETAVEHGALIEFTQAVAILPKAKVTVALIHELIEWIGAEHCVLTTDVFFAWQPPLSESLRTYLGQLSELGLSDSQLRTMVRDNPSRILEVAQ